MIPVEHHPLQELPNAVVTPRHSRASVTQWTPHGDGKVALRQSRSPTDSDMAPRHPRASATQLTSHGSIDVTPRHSRVSVTQLGSNVGLVQQAAEFPNDGTYSKLYPRVLTVTKNALPPILTVPDEDLVSISTVTKESFYPILTMPEEIDKDNDTRRRLGKKRKDLTQLPLRRDTHFNVHRNVHRDMHREVHHVEAQIHNMTSCLAALPPPSLRSAATAVETVNRPTNHKTRNVTVEDALQLEARARASSGQTARHRRKAIAPELLPLSVHVAEKPSSSRTRLRSRKTETHLKR